MAASAFMEHLSTDIKSLIVSFVTRPKDLQALCLVCKQLREIATRHLYRIVELDVGGEADLRLTAFLRSTNPGLAHIREISLTSSSLNDDGDESDDDRSSVMTVDNTEESLLSAQAHFATRLILDLIPNNILERFSPPWNLEFAADNLVLLCKKQKKLRSLGICRMDKDLDRILEKQPELISNLPNLRTLCLAPSSVNELAACQKVVENAPHLTNLCIDSCFYDIADDLVTELDDNSARPGLITSTIFGHMAPFKDCKPLALRSLVLNSVNLRYASDTYMEIIEFRSLERLAIENCGGADAIIAEITKSAHRPSNLRSFGLFHEEDSQNYTIAALENFLLSFSGIQTINISLSESRRLPTISCFTKHGNTLKELVIHAKGTENDNKPLQYPTDDFNTICRECIKVRQLAVTFPPFNINSPNFSPEFDKYLLSAWHLRDLVTLNITNWPEQNQTNESYVEYQFNNYAVHPARNSRNHRRSRRGRGNPRGPIAPPPGPPPPPMGRGGRGVVNPPGLMMIPPPPPPGIAHYNGVSMSRTMYEHVCQLIAQRIFDANREHAKSKQRDARLRVVAFGFRSEEDFCRSISGGKRRQISFLPSKLTDPFGQTLDSVTRLKRDMVQFVEPESMVLTPSPFILDSAG